MNNFNRNQLASILTLISFFLFHYCSSTTEPESNPLVLSFETVDASYLGAEDGSINLIVTGGTSPYSYLWSTGSTIEDINQLSAGMYAVTVTDTDGNQKTDSVEIIQPDNIGRLTDIDGNIYKTIKIGEQWWMAENLKVTHDPAGSAIESIVYNDDLQNEAIYGRLYTWTIAMNGSTSRGARGISPEGWHIPSLADWNKLINYLGGADVAGGEMKEAGLTHWLSPNTGATNSSGFTALAGGEKDGNTFQFKGGIAIFWTSNQTEDYAYYFYLSNDDTKITQRTWKKDLWYSIRCVKDE